MRRKYLNYMAYISNCNNKFPLEGAVGATFRFIEKVVKIPG